MKNKTHHRRSESGFTRLELVATVLALLFLVVVAAPGLGGSKLRSEQVSCLSNLRQIGHAVHLWANDHGDRVPWLTPAAAGGTLGLPTPSKGNAYFQMAWMSNELVSPKILVCPADRGVRAPRRMASSFSLSLPDDGFLALGDRALSYTIGLHAFLEVSRSQVSGDRNIRWDGVNNSCAAGVGEAQYLFTAGRWTNAIHGLTGNILFSDGTVEQLSTAGLHRAAGDVNQGERTLTHFLVPN